MKVNHFSDFETVYETKLSERKSTHRGISSESC